MRVYRIESPTSGLGPWRCDAQDGGATAYDNARHEDHPSAYSFPEPHGDGLMRRETDFCGFLSLTQLEHWFRCEKGRTAMAAAGMEGVVYDVPDHVVQRGGNQCLFAKSFATKCGSFDLVTLTEMDHA